MIVGRLRRRSRAVGPDWRGDRAGADPRGSTGTESLLLAAGILGATVMPHVIYLHSALTQRPHRRAGRDDAAAHLPRSSSIDVIIAMGIAGLINMTMLMMAAAVVPRAAA